MFGLSIVGGKKHLTTLPLRQLSSIKNNKDCQVSRRQLVLSVTLKDVVLNVKKQNSLFLKYALQIAK